MTTRVRAAIGAVVSALVLTGTVRVATAGAPAGGGRWWLTEVAQRAAGTGGGRDVRVWLPPSYDRPESAGRHYPVVLFLHGWPGGEGNWPGCNSVTRL